MVAQWVQFEDSPGAKSEFFENFLSKKNRCHPKHDIALHTHMIPIGLGKEIK
jgi:hypothetical protein